MPRLSTLWSLTAAAAIVCVAVAPAGAAAAPAPRTTTDPAEAAAGWLAQQFGDHLEYVGFPGFDGGTTADVLFALAASKSGAAKIAKTVSYFEVHVDSYTSIHDTSGKPGPYDGSVAKTALAVIVTGADASDFGGYNLLQTLKTDQCTAASAPTSDTDYTTPTCPAAGAARNIFSSISESFAILAEARSGGAYAPDAKAVSYFLSLQCADGGFTSATAGGTGCASDIDATGYAVAALVALGGHGGRVQQAVAWLDKQRHGKPYWTSNGGPNVDSTGLAASALAAAGRNPAAARAWLISQQVTSGPTVGKNATRGALKYQGAFDPAASVKATADGMLGLALSDSLATLKSTGSQAETAVLALAAPTVAKREVQSNATQTITGRGFQAREQVRATLSSSSATLSRGTADKQGTVTLRFGVPAGTPGTQTVVLTGARSGLTTRVSYQVEAPTAVAPSSAAPTTPVTAPSSSGPQLADTGRNGHALGTEIVIGLGCLVLGGLATLAGRRRTR